METMDKTQRLNRTILCPSCGEMFSISYKRCPFCGGSVRKRQQANPVPATPKSVPTQAMPKEVAQEPELPEDFSADIDWTPELDDGMPTTPTTRGGKRLQRQNSFSFGRILAVLLSILIVAAAVYIVITKVVPIVQQRMQNKEGTSQGEPTPPAGEAGNTPAATTSFRLLDTKITLTQAGETKQLDAVYEGEGEMGTLKWESSDTQVVMVTNDGRLNAVNPGTATVTATRKDGTTAQCEVTCLWDKNAPIANLSLNKVDFTIGAKDPDVTLKVIGTTEAVKWSVENSNVVTVSESGVVKYAGKGKTKVIATVGNQTLTCVVYGK